MEGKQHGMTDGADSGSRDASAAPLMLVPQGEAVARRQREPDVFFDRAELDAILSVYGRKVAEGEWRDYAMGAHKDVAVFAVFRRASEMPLYRIEKRPKLARRQGAYSVVAPTGLILKRGNELKQVLKIFEKRSLRLIDA